MRGRLKDITFLNLLVFIGFNIPLYASDNLNSLQDPILGEIQSISKDSQNRSQKIDKNSTQAIVHKNISTAQKIQQKEQNSTISKNLNTKIDENSTQANKDNPNNKVEVSKNEDNSSITNTKNSKITKNLIPKEQNSSHLSQKDSKVIDIKMNHSPNNSSTSIVTSEINTKTNSKRKKDFIFFVIDPHPITYEAKSYLSLKIVEYKVSKSFKIHTDNLSKKQIKSSLKDKSKILDSNQSKTLTKSDNNVNQKVVDSSKTIKSTNKTLKDIPTLDLIATNLLSVEVLYSGVSSIIYQNGDQKTISKIGSKKIFKVNPHPISYDAKSYLSLKRVLKPSNPINPQKYLALKHITLPLPQDYAKSYIKLKYVPYPKKKYLIIKVSKSHQRLHIYVNNKYLWNCKVSTARRGYVTPSGHYKPYMLERMHYSRKYHNSPMPWSVFFKGGYAIHGTHAISHLGRPASHGCVRVHPRNAKKIYRLIRKYGKKNTKIIIQG